MLAAQAASSVVNDSQRVPVLLQCCPGMGQQLLGTLVQHADFLTRELRKDIPESPELIIVHSAIIQLLTAVAKTRDGVAALLDENVTTELAKLTFLCEVPREEGQQSLMPVRERFTRLLLPVLELVSRSR